MDIDEEMLEAMKDAEIRTLKNILVRKIGALKITSQNVHGNYIALGVEYKCEEPISLLSPLFST